MSVSNRTLAAATTTFVVWTTAVFTPLATAEEDPRDTTEAFYVSRIGKAYAAETRELLKELYNTVAAAYDQEIEQQRAQQIEAFEGTKVRILKVLEESDDNGPLYLCAYDGGPKVFSIAGDKHKVGELTPALQIEENGEHTVEITRTIVEKSANRDAPALENDGVVTFFGIPLVFDDGPAKARSAPKPPPKSDGPKRSEVTEKQTLPKFKSHVSTDKLEEGPALMSTDLFLANLKNGNVYTVVRDEDRRCQICRGFGRVTDTIRPAGMREPDGRIACLVCKGVGKNKWHVTYQVAW